MRNHVTDDRTALLVQLLERIAEHDVTALQTLYELTSSSLLAVAVRILGRRELVEEVLQDAFVNIWRFAPDYQKSVSLPMAWMRTIVRNRTFDYLRRSKYLAGPEVEWNDILDEVLATETPDPYDLAVSSQRAWQLALCMQALHQNQRRALELAYFYGLSHAEIANQMDAPLGTVKAWIRRATVTLKISLITLETSAPSTQARGCSLSSRSATASTHDRQRSLADGTAVNIFTQAATALKLKREARCR